MGGVQSRTAGVRKCRSLQIVRHDLVNMLEWCNGHTHGVQGAKGPPSLVELLYTESTGIVMDDLWEAYRAVQQEYENVIHCRLFATT